MFYSLALIALVMTDQERRAAVQRRMDEHGFLSWLDVRVEDVATGRVVLRIPYREALTNRPFGGQRSIHGGVAATVIDSAAGAAIKSELPDGAGTATIDLNVSYLRPATSDLVATGNVIRIGKSVGVASVTVESETNGDRSEVAVGRGSFRIFRPDE